MEGICRNGLDQREMWLKAMLRIADPVLENLSKRQLKKLLPCEFHSDRSSYAPLEAFARLTCGMAPWLELEGLTGDEKDRQEHYRKLVLACIDSATDPASDDYMNFTDGGQPLVDAAFLSHALVRAPKHLIGELTEPVKKNLVNALKLTRSITTSGSNWLFFTAMVEAALYLLGEKDYDRMRIGYAIDMFEEWYKGDGVYGDGRDFHWDYYNSFVIQPMYVDIITLFEHNPNRYAGLKPKVIARAARYATIMERMIAPDGSYPIIGRSITYRFGVFQMLSQAALEHILESHLNPAQVRCALTAVIRKVMENPQMFDDQGWLRPGVYGYQPNLAEGYINIGSLYLCSVVFLPLGLPAEDAFWSLPYVEWTSVKVWSGKVVPIDHAL